MTTATCPQGALAQAAQHYADYGWRARELRAQGRKVIGYLSALGPVELITAAGLIPLRLRGNVNEPISLADAHMETVVCPFVRNAFDSVLKDRYAFLDGLVLPNLCDSISRTYDTWAANVRVPYTHFLNVPHLADAPSVEFLSAVLRKFVRSLETLTQRRIDDAAIAAAIQAHNANRESMRALYRLRQHNPPLITGVEMARVLVAAMSLPVEESTALIDGVVAEVKSRAPGAATHLPRIMLVGAQVDDTALAELVENAGASLVMDSLSMGSRVYFSDASATPDPIDGLAERYLRGIPLPTTYVGADQPYRDSLEERFGHLRRHVSDYALDGTILFIYKYCDPYGFEVPAMKSYLEDLGVRVLYLEDEYSKSSMGRLKTRIEAFVETLV